MRAKGLVLAGYRPHRLLRPVSGSRHLHQEELTAPAASEPKGEILLTRLALSEDVPALVELINLAYRVEEYFVAGDRTDAVEISSMMERGEFLVVDGSALDASHGVLNLAACVYLQTKAAPAYLGLLCVDPELQSHGLGRRLMEAGERRVLDKGACELDLLVVNLRTELVGWYLSQGYEEIGTEPFSEPRRLLEPCHFLRLRKALAQASVS